MIKCTQGSIIFGVRTGNVLFNRLRIKSYGIVISARCDLAQEKISKIHTLSAIDIFDWIKTELLAIIIDAKIKKIHDKIRKWAINRELDYKALIEFGPDNIIKNINFEKDKSQRSELQNNVNVWKTLTSYDTSVMSEAEKVKLINNDFKKDKSDKLKSLLRGDIASYCFLPKCSYSESDSKLEGLVVDLKDIGQIPFEHIVSIINNAFDYKYMSNNSKNSKRLNELNKLYMLENNEDFVTLCNEIKSPWVEFLMQRFSNAFCRVGVDNAEIAEIIDFCEREIN
jgi:hypothetical protein